MTLIYAGLIIEPVSSYNDQSYLKMPNLALSWFSQTPENNKLVVVTKTEAMITNYRLLQ